MTLFERIDQPPTQSAGRIHEREDAVPRIRFLLDAPSLNPSELIKVLKYRPDLIEAYDGEGAAGLSVEVHTQRVLRQFETYFSRADSFQDQRGFLRLFLALHDLGKPRSIVEGRPENEHAYTEQIMDGVFAELDIDEKDRRLARGLISHDPIGEYLQGKVTVEDAVGMIIEMSKRAEVSPEFMEKLSEAYFQVDAGSYTKDAGGEERLDFLFRFDTERHSAAFSQTTEQKMLLLRKAVSLAAAS